ncbi:MAG TPA: TerD family protein [Patescibacteria group bacterium]|nr:TerD family protein [Patescibacteria group bacterium]
MGISLRKEIMKKDEEVNLLEVDPALHKVFVGLGWEAPETKDGHAVDIDASAFVLNREGKVRRDTDFIFYNNLETDGGVIQHKGDNTTGEKKEGDTEDAEVIMVNLENLSYDVERVAFSVTIHNADDRQQNFGDIKNAYMRVVNADTGSELARFDLTEDASSDNAMIFGELFRDGLGWKFKAMGAGSKGGLFEIARNYGVNVAPP